MPSRRKSKKSVTLEIEKVLAEAATAEDQVMRQERFSAVGVDYGAEFTPAATGEVAEAAGLEAAIVGEEAEPAAELAAELAVGPAPAAAARAGRNEPIFDEKVRKQIQGNVIPGFNKDYQHFLFYRMGEKQAAKAWLKWIAPMISSMDEVLAFNRMYRVMRFRLGDKEVPIKATWVNIALSCGAIAALTSKQDALKFGEESFRQGLAERSAYLGDPTDPTAVGNKHNWVVGGPDNEADILVIAASDHPKLLSDAVAEVKAKSDQQGLKLVFEQPGETLPGPLRGHEHFGFKDGVSQPGVRGRVSEVADDYITPRYISPDDPRSELFAKPGQLLVWPGQFLLGMPRQSPERPREPDANAAQNNYPRWAKYGSYLVCRRLRQDVRSFWEFVLATAASLGVPAPQLAAMLVGRWPSGAPVMRTPGADIPALGADDLANNHFLFDDSTRPSNLIPIPGYPGDPHPQAKADMLGLVCPHFAHIRKVNPRDSSTDLGKIADSLIRMIIRRGIPFGQPVVGPKKPSPSLWKKERGLVFICYQSSIEEQFEFLTRRWSNSQIQPNVGGYDPIIGQANNHGNRARFFDFPKDGGLVRVQIGAEWVVPTGGGYFFAPPISAIATELAS